MPKSTSPVVSTTATRRLFAAGLAATLMSACLLASAPAAAQSYPSKPIEWVVPYPAGGGTDVLARTLAEAMSRTLGQPIVINNKPGAATSIGAAYVAEAKADGYTLLSADTATLAANPFLYRKLPYDAEKSFAPIGLTVRFPLILAVNPQVPAKDLKEFTAWAKTQQSGQNGANYGSPGAGSPHHLATALFAQQAQLTLTHVPYRGAAPAIQDVAGGQIPFMFVDTAAGKAFLESGKLKPIGVASARRVRGFNTIPTLNEQGLKGFEAYAWQGVVVPAGTPAPVVAKLHKALHDAFNDDNVKARLIALGLEAILSTPEEMATYAAAERAKWGPVIKAANITVE
jgi:tripartite-type tricarboxylate transporter receptor subunit TctC